MSRISPQRIERAIRERFSPIRGLSPQKLGRVLDQYHAGQLREAALLWDAMERRDLLIRTVSAKRKKAVARAQYEILAINKSERALLHKTVLEKFYDNLEATDVLRRDQYGGIGLLRRQMMDAVGKGFAVHEIVWKPIEGEGSQRAMGKRMRRAAAQAAAGAGPTAAAAAGGGPGIQFMTAEFIFCPLWFFENLTGELRFLESEGASEGVEMADGEWLVTVGDAIMEPCSVAYCYKHMGLKDWVIYSQSFGSPIPWGKTPAARGTKEWEEVETAVSQLMSQMSIVTSNDETISLIESKAGGSNFPMPNLVEYCDRGIAALWRGADLSTISQGQAGIGASLQGDESNLLQEDDANDMTEGLWRIDKMVIRMVLGDEEPLAYIKILPPKKQAAEQDIRIDEFLVKMGCKLSQDDALERNGRSPAQEGDDILQTSGPEPGGLPGQVPAARMENERSAADAVRAAKRRLMSPVLAELRRIDAMDNEEARRDAARALLANMPALRARLETEIQQGELADELEGLITDALAQGFEQRKGSKQ